MIFRKGETSKKWNLKLSTTLKATKNALNCNTFVRKVAVSLVVLCNLLVYNINRLKFNSHFDHKKKTISTYEKQETEKFFCYLRVR